MDGSAAVAAPSARALAAAQLQRARRSGALFAPIGGVLQGVDVDRMRGPSGPMDVLGVIDDSRGGALFVPLARAGAAAPR